MKVVAFNGSPRPEGNTNLALNIMADELKQAGIETEIINVGLTLIRGCTACGGCVKNRDEKCVQPGDNVNIWIQKMKQADGIIIGSPVHFSGIGATMKAFLDRAFYVCGVNNSLLRHKVACAVVSVRRSGGVTTFDQLNHYLTYGEMFIPTSNYWNVVHGRAPGEMQKDEEGVQTLKVLARNMAYLLKLQENGRDKVQAPQRENKIYMSFIR